jgi:hypothetical protein
MSLNWICQTTYLLDPPCFGVVEMKVRLEMRDEGQVSSPLNFSCYLSITETILLLEGWCVMSVMSITVPGFCAWIRKSEILLAAPDLVVSIRYKERLCRVSYDVVPTRGYK